MMGPPLEREEKLFHIGVSLSDRVPEGYLLRRIDTAVDFSFVRREVAHLYGINGNEGLDPALILRLMLLVFLEKGVSERQLMEQMPMRLDWLWFCRLGLDDRIPSHSVLSKARRRWGLEVFEAIFSHVLRQCQDAGLIDGETVHADSTLLRANADRDRRVSRKLWEQLEAGLEPAMEPHDTEPPDSPAPGESTESPKRSERATKNRQQASPTDPDAAIHTRQGMGTVLGYRDHRLVDDACGVILATHVTPADGDDGAQLPILLRQMESRLGHDPLEVTGDSQYGTRSNYELCESLGIDPYLKKRRGKGTPRVSWLELLPECCSRERAKRLSGRRRHVAEGSFAEAHRLMDHRRCRWRRIWRVQIQAYLVATAQNLKKLAKSKGRRPAAAAAAVLVTTKSVASAPHLIHSFLRRLSAPLVS